ncbi:OPT oligopeptide transporter protein-domain-containing protein [Fennellomyces sp. T-0311]|nr:OPT oligopeptide transporter protein-domain-containing protein [Fennellomyces sp. T-0311]
MYFGLQTGWISMMSLQASLLGYAAFKPFRHKLDTPFGPIENVVLQTTAVATATMPLAAGFVGIIPALGLLTTSDHPDGPIILPGWQLILWSLGVAFFGVFFAVPLRKQTIIREKLRFPSGTATAQMISLLHQDRKEPVLRRRHQSGRDSVLAHEDRPLLESASSPTYSPTSTSSTQSGVALTPISHSEQNLSSQQSDNEESWTLKLQALIISFSLSSAYTLLSYFFPIIYALPLFNWLSFNLVDFVKWEWYFTPSLSYVGQGIIMGLPTTISMLLGCVIGWGILSPIAHYAGWAPGPVSDWKTGSKGWILWISLGVMIAESIVSLGIVLVRSIVKFTYRRKTQGPRYHRVDADDRASDANNAETHIEQEWTEEEEGRNGAEKEETDAPPEQLVKPSTTLIGLAASTALCVCTVAIIFGTDVLPVRMAILAVAVAMFLSILAVRALGETDLNPVSGIGKISQVIFALVMPGGIAANLIAGGIAEAGAQQAGDLMQDLKTGHLLQASPKAQFYGQLIGSFVSAFVATGAYKLYTTVYSIPGPEFPVPTAHVWLDMSRLVNGHPLPPHVTEFVLLFSFLFAIFVLLKESNPESQHVGWRRYIPQGIAFAIGMYNPPSFTLARVIGGFLGHWWDRYCDSSQQNTHSISNKLFGSYQRQVGKVFIIIVASGFVLGEGTFAIVNLILRACDVPHF